MVFQKRKQRQIGSRNIDGRKRKRFIMLGSMAVIVLSVGTILVLKFSAPPDAGNSSNIDPYANGLNGMTTVDAVAAYGVIQFGTVQETLEIQNMISNLQIEEIMVSSGDTVAAGDALVRFSEESVEEALEELKANLREKELAYRAGAIEYEQSLITAKYSCDSTILKGKQADAVYQETVAELKSSLESATKTYNESVALLEEYKTAEETDQYRTDYQVDDYQQLYDENLALLKAKMEEWGVAWEDVTRGGARLGDDTYSQYIYVCQQLYSVLESNAKEYETAKTNYENEMADLSYNRLTLQLNMSSIEETYLNAQKNYEINLLKAEQTRQTAKTNAELAESEYKARVEKAKTDFDTLKSAYEDAQEDYDIFCSSIVNNKYVASIGGTVMRVSVRNNGRMSAGDQILTYLKSDDVTVSVSVDQSDIAKLAVGDTAVCYADSVGMLSGSIVSISPVTQSESISTVNYSVTVKLDKSDRIPSSNTTVTVFFGMDMDAASGMDLGGVAHDGPATDMEGIPDMGNMQNMEGMPDMGNMPNMEGMPDNGNRPNSDKRPQS